MGEQEEQVSASERRKPTMVTSVGALGGLLVGLFNIGQAWISRGESERQTNAVQTKTLEHFEQFEKSQQESSRRIWDRIRQDEDTSVAEHIRIGDRIEEKVLANVHRELDKTCQCSMRAGW